MCFDCQNRWQKEHREAMEIANDDMDARGIPQDSVIRGLADMQLACNANPVLAKIMKILYPSAVTLLESPVVHDNE